jgi:hypothetical protein
MGHSGVEIKKLFSFLTCAYLLFVRYFVLFWSTWVSGEVSICHLGYLQYSQRKPHWTIRLSSLWRAVRSQKIRQR